MIGIGIGAVALLLLLLQLAEMYIQLIQQQEIMKQAMKQAKRIRWICRPEGCVEIPMDWDGVMEETTLKKNR